MRTFDDIIILITSSFFQHLGTHNNKEDMTLEAFLKAF